MKFSYILIYFAAINIEGIVVNIQDKLAAKRGARRVPEAKLWIIALLGGAPFSYLTMLSIRHKTKHKSFMIGMPLLSVADIAVFLYFLYKLWL